MPGQLTRIPGIEAGEFSSAELAEAIDAVDFSGCSATVFGYGFMGKQYVGALRALGVGNIRVCSRSFEPLAELRGMPGVTTVSGGFLHLDAAALPGELGIVATPIADSVSAAKHLASKGFSKILIEKPASLWSSEIDLLAQSLESQGVEAVCAYNRLTYPSLVETRARAGKEGGITSCFYTFTEMIQEDWPERYNAADLARWGIANSLHPISMAHGLIGLPAAWQSHRSGSLPWHPSGSIFVGSGVTDREIPFAYQADWGSKGRWSVEVHTSEAAYRLCPLEELYTKTSALGEWEEIPLNLFAPQVKAGIAEQVAGMLREEIRSHLQLVSIQQAATLTEYAEELFGYREL